MRKWVKWLLLADIILFSSCGTPKDSGSIVVSWQSDGNPTVPVCGTVLVDCKSSITVLDVTSGTSSTVSVEETSVTMSNANDTYEARTNGYNDSGKVISSPYETVP